MVAVVVVDPVKMDFHPTHKAVYVRRSMYKKKKKQATQRTNFACKKKVAKLEQVFQLMKRID